MFKEEGFKELNTNGSEPLKPRKFLVQFHRRQDAVHT